MKKLFTLVALLAMVLGAKAVEVVDAEVNFANSTEVKYYGWGASDAAKERLSISNGCLYFHSEEKTVNNWDVQFFPIGGVDVETGVTYTLKMKIKGSVEQGISAHFGGVTKYGQLPITTDWQEVELQYEASDNTGTSGSVLFQCGDYVGDFWIESMKITHEERAQRPVEWVNMLQNGDAEGEFGDIACVQSKEFGVNLDEAGSPQVHNSEITTLDGNKVFVCHAKAVDPVITFDVDTEQWGTTYKAGDPKPDNAWQNQIWITLPRALKADEQVKISFKYKASRKVNTSTQNHKMPGDYLDGGKLGDVEFTTDWQTFEKTFSASATMQSIAFNLGAEVYTEDMDFYLDDVNVSLMKLDDGIFVASTNTVSGLVDYDFDNAVQATYDEEQSAWVATIGTKGNQDSWVNEAMISTVRGNDKAFKAATFSATVTAGEWVNYKEASNAKIKLPAAGVWTVAIDTIMKQICFTEVEGEAVKEPITITANPTVITVNALERDYLSSEQEGGTGAAWDNQFWIFANRAIKEGEVTVIEFDYVASKEAKTTTQAQGLVNGATTYLHYKGIGDVTFTTTEQHFSYTLTFTKEQAVATVDGSEVTNHGIAFNMAEIKDACDYTIKNVVWKLADNTESLIDQTGDKNFWIKVGAGTAPYCAAGISNVVADSKANAPIYNLAGQRVSKNFKGIVVKSGVKYIAK